MKILIDIGHPGHVHLFRPFAKEMEKKGHNVLFTFRQKEFEKELLEAYGFKNKSFGKHYKSKAGKIWGLVKFNTKMFFTILKFRPKILMSHGSLYAAQMAWLTGRTHISMEDSGNMEQIRLYLPFTKCVITPDILEEKLGKKQIRYKAYHELAYLHPSNFNKDESIKNELQMDGYEKYAILRLVSWNATHDVGHKGFTPEQKSEVINKLSKHFKLFISSESELPKELEQYQIKFHPSKLHQVIAGASMVISEGATIASEAGVLGIPTIYVNSIVRCYNEDQEEYGTIFNFRNGEGVIEKIDSLLSMDKREEYFLEKRAAILKDKINVSSFLVWFIENWPNSFKTMKSNPDYQFNFK